MNIPTIIVRESPFESKKRRSYGVVLYSRGTDEWLVLKSKDSSGLIAICRGQYHQSRIPELLLSMSRGDIESVISSADDIDKFRSLCQSVDSRCFDYVVDYAYNRLVASLSLIKDSDNCCTRSVERDRTWPKGKPKANEKEIDTALRELKEETGIDMSLLNYEVLGKVEREYFTYTNLKYIDTYFVCSVERRSNNVFETNEEVSIVEWVSSDDLKTYNPPLVSRVMEMAMSEEKGK